MNHKEHSVHGGIGFVLNGGLQRVAYFGVPVIEKFNLTGHPEGTFTDAALQRVIDN